MEWIFDDCDSGFSPSLGIENRCIYKLGRTIRRGFEIGRLIIIIFCGLIHIEKERERIQVTHRAWISQYTPALKPWRRRSLLRYYLQLR